MNLDKMIKIKMIELSKKYDISLVEIQTPKGKGKKKWISKSINFNYRPKKTSTVDNECVRFYNKRDFVSWLMCLE